MKSATYFHQIYIKHHQNNAKTGRVERPTDQGNFDGLESLRLTEVVTGIG